jgi:hypothetical protein
MVLRSSTFHWVSMYTIDEQDKVVSLDAVPRHSPGAPMPLVLASDIGVVLAFETAPRGEEVVILKFVRPRAHYFGPPNDEALTGHPLARRGLKPYGVFEVIGSSWIRSLERMNQVHTQHDRSRFERLRHFVFTFHDDTFECVAEAVDTVACLPNDEEAATTVVQKAIVCLNQA